MFLIRNLPPKIIKIDFNKVIAKIKWCSFLLTWYSWWGAARPCI